MSRTLLAAPVLLALAAVTLLVIAGTDESNGDPRPSGSMPSPAQPPGKEFGFNDAFHGNGVESETEVELIRTAAGTVARMPMSWAGLERERDRWNEGGFDRYEGLHSALLAAGITPQLSISGAPTWARDPGPAQECTDFATCIYPPAPEMLGEWREFVVEVTRRFPGATIEVWNEPNHLGQWRSGVDPERYAALLAAAHEALEQEGPETRVMMGGLGFGTKRGSIAIPEFLDRAYAASPSLKGHTEAINLHLYPGPNLDAGSRFAEVLEEVRAVRAAHDDEATLIYVSEIGITTTGPAAVSEPEQADVVLRATRKLLTMPDVSGVIVHRLLEPPEYPGDHHERGFGLLRPESPVEPKVAYCALTRAADRVHPSC